MKFMAQQGKLAITGERLREFELAVAKGYNDAELAVKFNVTVRTVQNYRKRLLDSTEKAAA